MLTKGDVLNERYAIEERVGSGGYGTVFRARDKKENRLVAIKVLRADLADDPDYRRRFRREADIARMLKSDHVVKVLDSDRARVGDEEIDFLTMEFVEGRTLQERLRDGPIPLRKALYIAAQLAEAIEEAELRGIVHRDVKPKNIFIGKSEFARLGDFGIARATDFPSLQPDDPILGTPRYMSPEQALGNVDETDARSDIYSLGVVLYEMIAGKPPFEGDSPNVIAYKHVNEQAKPLRAFSKHVPDEVEQLMRRCLAKRPEERFQSAGELREVVWSLIEGVSAAGDTPITPVGVGPGRLPLGLRVRRTLRVPKLRRAFRSARRPQLVALTVAPAAVIALVVTIALAGGGPTEPPIPTSTAGGPASPPSSTTPTDAFLPPEASRLAYLRQGENGLDLVVAYGDGKSGGAIAQGLDRTSSALSWSPAGDELAACGSPGGVLILGLDGGNRRDIPGLSCDHLAWSHSGELLAFAARANDGPRNIYVVNRDGTGLRNLTNSRGEDNRYVSWSPDSRSIAFIRDTASGQADLYNAYLPDGAVGVTASGVAANSRPVWSPDGKSLLLEEDAGIFTVPLSDGISEPISTIPSASSPTWSPDGRALAYVEHDTDNPADDRLMVIATGGRSAKEIVRLAGHISGINWSPDGKQLLYALEEGMDVTATSFFVAPVEGKGVPHKVLEAGSQSPTWSPRQATPSVSLRTLVPGDRTFEKAAFANMDGSAYGQIAIESTEPGQCEIEGSAPRLIHRLSFFSYSSGQKRWVEKSSTDLTTPVIPDDPCLYALDTRYLPVDLQSDEREELAVVAYHVPKDFVGHWPLPFETHLRIINMSPSGKLQSLYSDQLDAEADVYAADNALSVELPISGPDNRFLAFGYDVLRLTWDAGLSKITTTTLASRLRCEEGEVGLVNVQLNYLVVSCGPFKSWTSAYYRDTTVFEGVASAADLHIGQSIRMELPPNVSLSRAILYLAKVSVLGDLPAAGAPPDPVEHFELVPSGNALWWDRSEQATEYRIEFRYGRSQEWNLIEVLPAWLQSWSFPRLDPIIPGPIQGDVAFRVTAWNSAGQSASTPEIAVFLSAEGFASTPTPSSLPGTSCLPPDASRVTFVSSPTDVPLEIHFSIEPIPTPTLCSDLWFWHWDFGDGEATQQEYGGSGFSYYHTYPQGGSYRVTVAVRNGVGQCQGSQSISVVGPSPTSSPTPSATMSSPAPTAAPTATPVALPATPFCDVFPTPTN